MNSVRKLEYVELTLKTQCNQQHIEILEALLLEAGYEGIQEIDNGLVAYILNEKFSPELPAALLQKYCLHQGNEFSYRIIKEQNWNQYWESHFEPVIFPGRCAVRAPFHQQINDAELEIIIEPKMSFGTAHHETTAMMIEILFAIRPMRANVLDIGCGTGILAIIACKLGALNVTAIDNDPWAYQNAIENCNKNNCPDINVYLGNAQLITGKKHDLILANINRNILIKDLPAYFDSLNPHGMLVISGFMKNDMTMLQNMAGQLGLCTTRVENKGEWSAIVFTKNNTLSG